MKLINADHIPADKKVQIKIDIPEHVYYDALQYVECLANSDFELIMIRAIKNGVLLPKSHGRLIDAKSVNLIVKPITQADSECAVIMETVKRLIFDAFDKAPTVIEADEDVEE